MVTAVAADDLERVGMAFLHLTVNHADWLAAQNHSPPQRRLVTGPRGCLRGRHLRLHGLIDVMVGPAVTDPVEDAVAPGQAADRALRAHPDYPAAAWSPCRASWSSFSSSLDREVFRTVPPYLLIASTALSGVTFSSIRNSAEVPGLTMSRT